jgi:radical SAM superfamily enzyme YgiQ (UPF0313 family)
LFIFPKIGSISYLYEMRKSAPSTFSLYPLSIPILAALVPRDKFDMELVNEFWDEEVDFDSDADIIALSFLTASASRAYEIADHFRARGKLIAMGGVHVYSRTEEALQHADVVFRGEGEEIWPRFLNDYLNGEVKKIYEAPRPVPPELIPIPDRSITRRSWKHPYISLMASRGCPYRCDFCAVSSYFGDKCRCRPVESVINEIKNALAMGDIKDRFLVFKDDNIAFHRDYAKELFKAMVPLKIKWAGQANTKTLDDSELVELMGKSGCILMTLGLESIKENHIAHYKKSYTDLEKVKKVISLMHKQNIYVLGSFMFGFDDDTPESIVETARVAKKMGIDLVTMTLRTPFPGTPFYQALEKENRLIEKRWECYDIEHPVFVPKLMSPTQLVESQWEAHRIFYSTVGITSRIIRSGLRGILTGRWISPTYVLYFNLAARKAAKNYKSFIIQK